MMRCGSFQKLLQVLACCGSMFWALPGIANAQQSVWSSTAKSAGQHPIEVARFGTGKQYVLIVGSLSGNEPESLELMESAAQLAQKIAPPEPVSLLLIRTLNPDGAVDHMRTNSRGVELNRNFPSPNFTSIPNRLTGPAAGSEVETQYMLRVLAEYHPVRMIHIRDGFGDRPLITMNSRWVASGKAPVLPEDVYQGFFDQLYKAGSLEEYVSRELKAGVVTVSLSAKDGRQLKAAELLRFATSHVASESAAPPESVAQQTPVAPVEKPAQTPETPQENRVHSSVVEFLPPPPEYVSTSHTAERAAPGGERYFELAPPPH